MENYTKAIMAVILSVFTYLTNNYSGIFILLIFLMFMDYLTGIISAYINQQLESTKGLKGILKKVSFMMLVILGFCADIMVTFLVQKVGVQLSTNGMFGIATICWLISNESLSVIENLGEIGVPIPSFLKNAFVKIKDVTEDLTIKKG